MLILIMIDRLELGEVDEDESKTIKRQMSFEQQSTLWLLTIDPTLHKPFLKLGQ